MNKSIQCRFAVVFSFVLLLTGCGETRQAKTKVERGGTEAPRRQETATGSAADSIALSGSAAPRSRVQSKNVATRFDSLGLVCITRLDSTIAVSLLYTTPDNLMGEILYDDFTEAYLHPEAAEALLKAQRLLKAKHPGYTLIVYDAVRPMSVQRKMWDLVKGTSKSIYVANPFRGGGLHNYGLAVDISILDEKGVPLDMGTEVDHLGPEAHTTHESELVRRKIITAQAKENRELLRSVMRGAGFRALHSEWWHYNLYSREVAKKSYQLID